MEYIQHNAVWAEKFSAEQPHLFLTVYRLRKNNGFLSSGLTGLVVYWFSDESDVSNHLVRAGKSLAESDRHGFTDRSVMKS